MAASAAAAPRATGDNSGSNPTADDAIGALLQQRDATAARLAASRARASALRATLDPIVDKARDDTARIDKGDLETTRKLRAPPPTVQRTIELLARILNTERPGRRQQRHRGTAGNDDALRRLRHTITKKMKWQDCLKVLQKHPGEGGELSSRMISFVPKALGEGGRPVIALLRDAFVDPHWDAAGGDDGEATKSNTTAGASAPSPSLSPPRRRGGRAARVAPLMSVVGQKTGRENNREPLLTLDNVGYANKSCRAILSWCMGQLTFAQVLSDHGGDLHKDIEEAEQAIAVGARDLQRIEDALASERQVQAEEAEASKAAKLEAEAAANASEATVKLRRQPPPEPAAKMAEGRPKTPPPAAALEAFTPRPTPDGHTLVAETVVLRRIAVQVRTVIRVQDAEDTITSKVALQAISEVIDVMQEHPDLMIQIEAEPEGSHSAGGPSAAAMEAARIRVERVEREITRRGNVQQGRIRTSIISSTRTSTGGGRGRGRPHADNNTVTIRAIQEIQLLGTIKFSQMSSNVRLTDAETQTLLSDLAVVMRARPSLRVRVEGHTDDRPSFGQTNTALSRARAEAVARVLAVQFDVPREIVADVTGWGEARPTASNSTSQGRAKNRRVEFHIEDRQTSRAMRDLVKEEDAALREDAMALRYLQRLADGREPSSLLVRRAAADVLVASHQDWPVLRLLWLAARKGNPQKGCLLGMLDGDCVREICRAWFRLGGS